MHVFSTHNRTKKDESINKMAAKRRILRNKKHQLTRSQLYELKLTCEQ
jgi:hypothetical protein